MSKSDDSKLQMLAIVFAIITLILLPDWQKTAVTLLQCMG